MNNKYNLICICECKYLVNLKFKFLWPASEFLGILNVVFGEMTGNVIPKTMTYKPVYDTQFC